MEPGLLQPYPSVLSIVFQVHGGLCAPGAAARSYGGKHEAWGQERGKVPHLQVKVSAGLVDLQGD